MLLKRRLNPPPRSWLRRITGGERLKLKQHWTDYLASLVIASARKVEIGAACEHPRIASLRIEVVALEASDEQKLSLLQSIEVYREKFIDGSATPHKGWSDIESLVYYYSPGMGLEIWFYQAGQKQAQEKNEIKPRSTWHHPTFGLVELLKTYPGASNAKVKTLTLVELHGGGFHEKGNVYYVPRDQLRLVGKTSP
jgi:hypothetical protein